MIQRLNVQKVRIPALALGALALVAFGANAAPRLAGTSGTSSTIVVQRSSATLSQRALIATPQADSTACGAGAYVSGDLAGDTSPAAIYRTMCGGGR
jgi:hypothetical protein